MSIIITATRPNSKAIKVYDLEGNLLSRGILWINTDKEQLGGFFRASKLRADLDYVPPFSARGGFVQTWISSKNVLIAGLPQVLTQEEWSLFLEGSSKPKKKSRKS